VPLSLAYIAKRPYGTFIIYDSTARRLNITNQKVTQLAAKGAGAGGGKAKK